jgi:hypothetical protein
MGGFMARLPAAAGRGHLGKEERAGTEVSQVTVKINQSRSGAIRAHKETKLDS